MGESRRVRSFTSGSCCFCLAFCWRATSNKTVRSTPSASPPTDSIWRWPAGGWNEATARNRSGRRRRDSDGGRTGRGREVARGFRFDCDSDCDLEGARERASSQRASSPNKGSCYQIRMAAICGDAKVCAADRSPVSRFARPARTQAAARWRARLPSNARATCSLCLTRTHNVRSKAARTLPAWKMASDDTRRLRWHREREHVAV